MSNRSKGNSTERRAIEELTKEGFITYRVKGSSKWNKNVDMFATEEFPGFDICAKKGVTTRWIQVKTNRYVAIDKFAAWWNLYCSGLEYVEVWNWKDRKGWVKKSYPEVKDSGDNTK